MPIRPLSEIQSEYKQALRMSERDLSNVPVNVVPSHEIAKNEAKLALPKIKTEFSKALFESAYGFFLQGDVDKQAHFVSLLSGDAGVLVVDANAMYESIANEVEPCLGRSREFSASQIAALIRGMRDIASQLDMIGSIPMPVVGDVIAVHTHEDLVAHVRKVISASAGTDLMARYFGFKMIESALSSQVVDRPKVIVTHSSNEEAMAVKSYFKVRRLVKLNEATNVDKNFAIAVLRGQEKGIPFINS